MPYKSEKIPLGKYDRRVKLTDVQREEIKELRKLGLSYRVTDIVCDYKGVVIPDVFRLACGVFTKSNAPKVGDRVKLRYRIHKKTFEGFDMAKARIVEIIKA